MMRLVASILLCVYACIPCRAFTVPSTSRSFTTTTPSRSSIQLAANKDEKETKLKSGLDESVRDRLIAETVAPWRSLRLFLYGALGSGATIGGIIALTGVLAALSGNRPDLDPTASYPDLAIDFGFAALFAVLFKVDTDKGEELNEDLQAKIERKKDQRKLVKGMREREAKLKQLSLDIQISDAGKTTRAKVGELQLGAKQHMIIVAGPKKACRDAMIGANLMKNDFQLANVLVVPYDTDVPGGTPEQAAGFADRPLYETQPYVARAAGDGWEQYMDAEMDDAVTQSGERCKDEGIAIVIENTGQVIRRGVGTVPWRQIVNQLTGNEEKVLPIIGKRQ